MDVDFAFICDFAEVAGKINALGIGFDTIYAQQVPVTHPHFHLVAQLRASIAEAGDKEIAIRLIDADGNDVIPPINTTFDVPQPPAGATETLARLGLALNSIPFPAFTQYALHVVIQGHEMIRIPLRVAQPPGTE